eukprot:scaffold209088_cov14-Tisochrysis_lutea.AAC.1
MQLVLASVDYFGAAYQMKEQFGQLDLKHYGKRVLQSAWLCKGAECAAGPEVFETHKMFFQSAWLCKGAEYAAGPE